jgi:hypothetical protein
MADPQSYSASDVEIAPSYSASDVEIAPPAALPPEVQHAIAGVPRPQVDMQAQPFMQRQPGTRYNAVPGSATPEAQQVRLGRMVPQAAVPALETANQYAVQPFNRVAEGAATGAKNAVRTDVLGAAEQLAHPNIQDPEIAAQKAEREHPLISGAAEGIASLGASTVADPRNWPFFGSSAARPLLQRLMARGFAAGVTYQSAQAAKELHDNWDKMTPAQRAELGTQAGLGALMAAEAARPRVAVASSPEGTVASGTILGGEAGLGVARTPEATVIRGKVGPFRKKYAFRVRRSLPKVPHSRRRPLKANSPPIPRRAMRLPTRRPRRTTPALNKLKRLWWPSARPTAPQLPLSLPADRRARRRQVLLRRIRHLPLLRKPQRFNRLRRKFANQLPSMPQK